jgi:malic enzyme
MTTEIKLAAAMAIYEYNLPNLSKENLLPSILDKKVPGIIAEAITKISPNPSLKKVEDN